MEDRCHTCGCLLHFSAIPWRESLATPEQRAAEIAAGGYDGLAARLEQRYGAREIWLLRFACPGCRMHGTHYGTEYPRREELEARVEAQNRRAGTPEARAQAEHWEEEVARRAEHDARAFTALFPLRFPHWASLLPDLDSAAAPDPEESRWRLLLRLPPEHPSVKEPMEIRIDGSEVLISWIHGWHWHVSRREGSARADVSHLHQALDRIEEVVTERLSIIALYRGEALVSGGGLHPGTDPPMEYLEREGSGMGDRYVIVSWRGTDDREIRKVAGPNV